MKTALITATILALGAFSASATELRTGHPRQLYTCAIGGMSRVAMQVAPAPCCDGMLGCPQLLANTGLVKPTRPNRT